MAATENNIVLFDTFGATHGTALRAKQAAMVVLGIAALAADTDGIDGATDAAGALVDDRSVGGDDTGGSLDREAAAAALDAHDAYPVLDAAGALLRTGPTGTNVNDLRAVVIPARAASSEGTK